MFFGLWGLGLGFGLVDLGCVVHAVGYWMWGLGFNVKEKHVLAIPGLGVHLAHLRAI